MKAGVRRQRPSWRALDAGSMRPELWLGAFALTGVLLIEVWQSSQVAGLSRALDQTRSALVETQTHVAHLRARTDRRITRAELDLAARRMGLAPAHERQMIGLPAAYVAVAEGPDRPSSTPGVLAWAERLSRVLVPEATARVRTGN